MDGRDIAEVLAAGATAAQLGIAFLCRDEAGTPTTHREALRAGEKEIAFTSAFSGRTAREPQYLHRCHGG